MVSASAWNATPADCSACSCPSGRTSGAVFASVLPWLLSNVFDVASTAPEGVVPLSVRIAFYVGAAGLFGAVLWTVLSTREYSPEQIAAFERARGLKPVAPGEEPPAKSVRGWLTTGLVCAVLGALALVLIGLVDLEKELSASQAEDVRTVYEGLLAGSRKHLRSYVSDLKDQEIEYQPRYLEGEEFQEIVKS